MHLDFKKWLQDYSFGDVEFYYFPVTNIDTMVLSE